MSRPKELLNVTILEEGSKLNLVATFTVVTIIGLLSVHNQIITIKILILIQ